MKTEKQFALLRIVFGFVWLVDAFLKWQPAFFTDFVGQVDAMLTGQPAWIAAWINLWVHIVTPHAYACAMVVALLQTALAVGLILGLLTRVTIIGGMILSLLIWTVPEGFGGPYGAGVTDIGAALIYAFVFWALWIGMSWRAYSIDSFLIKKWPHFFLWKDTVATIQTEKKDHLVEALIAVVIVLASVLFVLNFPAPAQTMDMGPGATAPMGMMLKTYSVPTSFPTPTVDFTIQKDPTAMGGWDVHITTTNFTFTPQNVNSAPVPDQGHVHLYVDNTLYVVYGPWYHLDDLTQGTHVITVALAANDHSIYTTGGKNIEVQKTITQ